MPAPPIPNPTPYTCPNCGVGLQERAEFCPHCGARLESATPKSVGWIIATLALGLVTLAFGSVGACSVYFVIIGAGSGDYQSVIWMASIPLLLVGGVGVWLCASALLRRLLK